MLPLSSVCGHWPRAHYKHRSHRAYFGTTISDRIGIRAEGRICGTYVNTEVSWCDPLYCYGAPNNLWQFDVTAGLIICLGSY